MQKSIQNNSKKLEQGPFVFKKKKKKKKKKMFSLFEKNYFKLYQVPYQYTVLYGSFLIFLYSRKLKS